MKSLRDARLQQALTHAPDADLAPDASTRQAILQHAAAAVAPAAQSAAARRPWWRVLWPEPGASRMPWNAAFATVVLAGFITVLWQGRPVPEAQPDDAAGTRVASTPAGAPPTPVESAGTSPPSVPVAQAPADAGRAYPMPQDTRARAPDAAPPAPTRSARAASAGAPAADARAPRAQEAAVAAASPVSPPLSLPPSPAAPRAFPAAPAETAAAAPASPPPMVVPAPAEPSVAAAPAAPRAFSKGLPQHSAAADASATTQRSAAGGAVPPAGRTEAAGEPPALAGWSSLRVETPADGRTLTLSRSQAAALSRHATALAPMAGPDAPLAQAPWLRMRWLRGEETLALFEWTPANELRWTQFSAGQPQRWTAQAEAASVQNLQAELRRLGLNP